MAFFRFDPENKFDGPHQSQNVLHKGANPEDADAAMIMVHGRGATAQSILGLADEFEHTEGIAFFAPQASGSTWYPNSFLAPTEQNQPGLDSGLQAIGEIVQHLKDKGLSTDKIFLLGFSQGACLASEFAARHPSRYAGVIALSGGVIGNTVKLENYSGDMNNTPMFMGCSDVDAHIPVKRLDETEQVFKKLGALVTKNIYPGMGHLVNEDEIKNVNKLIAQVVA